MSKLLTRTLSGAVYVALFVFCIYSGRIFHSDTMGNLMLSLFLLFVAMVCTHEYYSMFKHRGEKVNPAMGFVLAAVMFGLWWLMGYVLTMVQTHHPEGEVRLPKVSALVVLWSALLMALLWSKRWVFPKTRLDHALMPAFYIAMPLAMMPMLNAPHCNVLMMVVALTWVNDSFAYLGGSMLGKHKLWVRHSPGKTWEGCLVGMLCCVAAAVLAGPLFETPLTRMDWGAVGVIVSVVGTLGDLTESMLKRHCEVKDSGKIMPGHGGLMDRFDSLLTIIPFVFAYLLLTH